MTARALHKIRSDERGAGAIEAALALPVLVTMIYGVFSMGQLYESNAGIEHALGEGARYANLCTSMAASGSNFVCTLPTDDQICARVRSKLFGTTNGTFDAPTVDSTSLASGYKTISVTYHQVMKFAFFTGPTITVTRSKRAYTADNGTSAGSVTTCS
ncbi:MAG: TadE/TadG family type IV pilus assembly protein [Sphingomonas sp.]